MMQLNIIQGDLLGE